MGVLSCKPCACWTGSLDLTTILTSIGVSGVSGGVLTAIVALIKDAMQKK